MQRATVLAAHHFLVSGESTVMEQYDALRNIKNMYRSEMACEYANPVQTYEYETVSELVQRIEEMTSDNVQFALSVIKIVDSEME